MANTIIRGALKWPSARIPLEIDELSFPPGSVERSSIDNAVNAWNTGSTVLRIGPRQGEEDFVRIVPDQLVARSSVGRIGGQQLIPAAYFPAIPAGAELAVIDQVPEQINCFYFDAAGALRVSWVADVGAMAGFG